MALALPNVPYLNSGIPGLLTPHAVQIHVTKHHQGYITAANNLLKGSPFAGKSVEEIIKAADGPIFNNVAQHFNHSFYWECLTEQKKGISEAVESVLIKTFGSIKDFKDQFLQKASTVFGSGWVYLSKDPSGGLVIKQYANALNPIKEGGIPLLTVDAWEHNWYIDYENRKAEFFERFFDHVNWSFVELKFKAAGLI